MSSRVVLACRVVLAAAARTPIGKLGGALSGLDAVALGAMAVRGALSRAPGLVPDGIMMGCVLQAGLGQNPARQAAIRGGVATTTPGVTVNDVCLAGMSAVSLAARAIRAGDHRTVLVGGFDSMSRAPHAVLVRPGVRAGDAPLRDLMVRDGLWCAYDDTIMGAQADATNAARGISRQAQDAWAANSQQRAAAAAAAGRLAEEIVPVEVEGRSLTTDEGIRPDTTAERLGTLRPVFTSDGTVTAGNASQLSDAASAGLLTTLEACRDAGLEPLAEVVDHAVVAGPDAWLHDKPARAARVLLERHGMAPRDVDLWEVNEAFAAVVIATIDELGVDPERVNADGGAIALGHPLGASGFRLLMTLARQLRTTGAELGVAAICGGGGQGEAIMLRRLR